MNESKIDIIKKGKVFSLMDLAAIALTMVIAIALVVSSCLNRTQGETLLIKNLTSNEESRYALSVDNEITIEAKGGKLVVVIKDGKAYVKEADCPDKVCVHSAAIRYKGDVILCAHLGIYIRVEGRSEYADIY